MTSKQFMKIQLYIVAFGKKGCALHLPNFQGQKRKWAKPTPLLCISTILIIKIYQLVKYAIGLFHSQTLVFFPAVEENMLRMKDKDLRMEKMKVNFV